MVIKIFFRLQVAILGLILTVCFFLPAVFALESNLPLPPDAIKISEKISESPLRKSLIRKYESSWDKNKLSAFYKKELKKTGWTDEKNDVFVKDNNIIVLQIKSKKNGKGKTRFLIIASNIPKKEEILAMRKNPVKLKFMPIYPGSEQLSLSDSFNGVSGIYKAEGSIREAVFFYSSKMLNYGWTLEDKNLDRNTGSLIFKKVTNEITETCKIDISGTSVAKTKVVSPNEITITARYYAHKKFKFKTKR